MPLQQTIELLISLIEMGLGIGMFAGGLTRRERVRWPLALAAAFLLALFVGVVGVGGLFLTSWAAMALGNPLSAALVHALIWLLIPLLSLPLIMAVCDTGLWPAAWCAAAGYTVQNLTSSLADSLELILGSGSTEAVALAPTIVIELSVAALCYTAAWKLLALPVHTHGLAASGDQSTLALLGLVFLAVILFDTANKQLAAVPGMLSLTLLLKAIHAVVCVFVLAMSREILVNRKLREESAMAQSMLAAERRQYALSRENIEAINVKCHDIRHQIRQLGSAGSGSVDRLVLEDIAREVSVYDSLIRTGNDVLDTILTEKSLVCEREGIAFRCIADGTALGFMAATDIYALFGNALDNAIEASRRVAEKDSRSISLTVREQMGLASIHVENRFVGEISFGRDGLPLTSKEDVANHGFGTRSMQLIARRYHGTITMRATDDVFHLNIALPIPE